MRRIAARASGGFGSDVTPHRQKTASKLPSGKSSCPASACLNSTFDTPDMAALSRAISSIRDEMSVATTRPADPTRLAASKAGSPIPVAMSSTRCPGSTSASSNMRSLTHRAAFSIVRHHILPTGGNPIPLLAFLIRHRDFGRGIHGFDSSKAGQGGPPRARRRKDRLRPF
nr:hypothetical protein [Lysobacter alkalisoli]